jgi:hypothetical protein
MRRSWCAGDWVEVRSKEEILQTLDANGRHEGMPFMPEMFAYCGQKFQVYKRAHKTCDTVFPVRGRRVHQAVHLSTRCNGEAHGGCQAGCLIFWKDVWLKPASPNQVPAPELQRTIRTSDELRIAGCSEADIWIGTRLPTGTNEAATYVCQATQLPYATGNLAWWDLRQYIEDYRSGNVSVRQLCNGLAYSMYSSLSQAGIGLGAPLRRIYDKLHPLWGGTLFPRNTGSIPAGELTPTGTLNLQPGELVRVKSHEEILQTLNVRSMNRGLVWDAEMVPYCGNTYRVLRRVTTIIDEKTGKMQHMKNPCIVLESVICQSRYSHCRMFCPRSIYPYWREIWLERVPSHAEVDDTQPADTAASPSQILPDLEVRCSER